MDGIPELLRGRSVRIVASEVLIARLVAVRAPVPLELTGVGVDHGDAMVAVAISDVRFVSLLIDEDLCHLSERPRVGAAGARVAETELFDELAILRELQHVAVVGAVAADP